MFSAPFELQPTSAVKLAWDLSVTTWALLFYIHMMVFGNNSKMMIISSFKQLGGKKRQKSGAFPSLDRDTDGRAQQRASTAASPRSHNYTDKPFNPENFVIDTAETVTVSTITNDRAFRNKRFNCGIDYDKHSRSSSTEFIQEKKNWYKNKKQNQTYQPLRDNGSTFTAPESSFGMSETNGSFSRSKNKSSSKKKWLGRYVAAKSFLWRWRCKDCWLGRVESSGELAAATNGYTSFGSDSRSRSSEGSSHTKDGDDNGKGVLSDVRLTYCDDSGVREEQIVWGM